MAAFTPLLIRVRQLESMGRYLAQFEYDAQEENELNFKEGECLDLLSRIDDSEEWWLMKNQQGLFGLIPANYVEPEGSGAHASTPPEAPKPGQNIFEGAMPAAKGTLKSLFPASRSKKKWPAELIRGATRIKGKLHLLDGTSVAFVHGREKVRRSGVPWPNLSG